MNGAREELGTDAASGVLNDSELQQIVGLVSDSFNKVRVSTYNSHNAEAGPSNASTRRLENQKRIKERNVQSTQ